MIFLAGALLTSFVGGNCFGVWRIKTGIVYTITSMALAYVFYESIQAAT